MALNLIIMGFLTSLIGPVVGAVVGGAVGKNSAKTDYKYQLKLMNKQQEYARENAATSNEYARENALDAPFLQKLGKQKAGINTAFGQNGSVASVGSGAMASAPNIPSPMGIGNSVASLSNAIGNNFSAVSQAVLQQEQAKKAASERQQVDIDNISRAAENIARIGKYGSDSVKANAEASFIDLQNRFKQATWESDVSLANSNATIQEANAETQYQMNIAHLYSELASAYERMQSGNLSKQQIETEKQKIKNLKQEINESKSRVRLNTATAANVDEQTEGYRLNNEYLSKTMQDRINQQSYETLIKKVDSLPKSYRDVVMRSYQWQVMCYKLEHNQPLSEQETKNLDELLKLDYYDPNKNFSNWINFVSKMK